MSAISYLDVFEIQHDDAHAAGLGGDILPGDVVRTSANYFPHFTVIAVDGDKAWLRNIQSGGDSLVALSRCRRVPAREAA
jgi:hypothetical protein